MVLSGLATLLLGIGLLGGPPLQATGQVQPPPASAPDGSGLRLDTARSLAEEAAQAWAVDARLVDVSATWTRADERVLLEGPRAWTLVFYSPERSAILYVAAGPGRARQGREARVHSPPPVADIPTGLIGPEEAVMVFLERGGRAFLEEHPGATVHLSLEGGEEGTFWALIAVDPGRGDRYGLTVDAATGQIRFTVDPSNGGGT
jgi:hypothetical protein